MSWKPSVKPVTIYLQLEHFFFSHGASQVGQIDDQFVGRKDITRRLTAILNHARTRSGAYLITGYRGVGKSSFVSKVLDDAGLVNNRSGRTSRYLRILSPVGLMALIKFDQQPLHWPAALCGLVIILTFAFLRRLSPHRVNLGPRAPRPAPLATVLADAFHVDDPVSHHRGRMVLQDAFLISVIFCAGSMTLGWVSRFHPVADDLFSVRLSAYALPWLAIAVLNAVRFWPPWDELRERISRYLKGVNRITLRINLGYDDLSEVDILRLIGRSLLGGYRRQMSGLSLARMPAAILKGSGLFLAAFVFRFSPFLRDGHQKLIDWFWHYAWIQKNLLPLYEAIDNIVQSTAHAVCRLLPYPAIPAVRGLAGWTRLELLGVGGNSSTAHLRVDYLFLLYFCAGWAGVTLLAARAPLGIVTHTLLLSRLRWLNDLIDSDVTEERNSEFTPEVRGWRLPLWPRKRRAQTYPRATEREIEKHLIEILNDFDRIPRLMLRPEFIFVFDEIDKIEPRPGETSQQGAVNDDFRQRQHHVLRLLSNLKYLLTTARAKFIFIAGREMFDAALADVSDRNFFMGSVFNDVIYVDSFLKDRYDTCSTSEQPVPEITNLTAHYVCNCLLPPKHRKEILRRRKEESEGKLTRVELTLDDYRSYLEREHLPPDTPTPTPTYRRPTFDLRPDAETTRIAQIDRIMGVLTDFVGYLTYRSNGAPKKIAAQFERYVVSAPELPLEGQDAAICAGSNDGNLFLRFTPLDQHTFGLGFYLITPLFVSLDRAIREFGDKLLVSSAFLVDQLYKFHRSGFSWRNIELTPEILDINRAPHLRELIVMLLGSLTRSHIQLIDNGLYTFKFRRRISDEIRFVSKLNERESAAFNFTLDESLAIKEHYRRQLKELEKVYGPYFGASQNPEFIRSISFLHVIMGDLHFYDEEFDNAIVEYMEAVQMFGPERVRDLPFELFVVVVRNTLKLGLAHERRKTYDSAFMTYGKLASRVIRFYEGEAKEHDDAESAYARYLQTASPTQYDDWLRDGQLTTHKEYALFKQTVMDSLRLMYQPSLAKFQMLEKVRPGGIEPADLEQLIREIRLIIGPRAAPVVNADYQQRAADVMFYKNKSWLKDVPPCHEEASMCAPNQEWESVRRGGSEIPCVACGLYRSAIEAMFAHEQPLVGKSARERVKHRLESLVALLGRGAAAPGGLERAESTWAMLARVLSDTSDTYLSCAGPKEVLSAEFLDTLHELADTDEDKVEALRRFVDGLEPDKVPAKIEEAMIYTYLAGALFRRAGDHRSAGWQGAKLLYVLRDHLRSLDFDNRKPLRASVRKLADVVSTVARKNFDAAYEDSYWLQQAKPHRRGRQKSDSAPPYWDTFEIEILRTELAELVRSRKRRRYVDRMRPLMEQGLTAPDGVYNRIMLLRRRAKQLERASELWHGRQESQIPLAIAECVYCWMEILRITRIHGTSYSITHTLVAAAHEALAGAYFTAQRVPHCDLRSLLRGHLSESDLDELEQPRHHWAEALRHYRMAIETHSNGRSYDETIADMVYLNDDFNDDLLHFCAGQERYWLNRWARRGKTNAHIGERDVYRRIRALQERLRAGEQSKINVAINLISHQLDTDQKWLSLTLALTNVGREPLGTVKLALQADSNTEVQQSDNARHGAGSEWLFATGLQPGQTSRDRTIRLRFDKASIESGELDSMLKKFEARTPVA